MGKTLIWETVMEKIYACAAELVGNTPLLCADRFRASEGLSSRLLVKLEGFNPAGSAKDRVACRMLFRAEEEGRLVPSSVIIEPTSGNTGIALAAFGVARGYRVILVMPSNASAERQTLARAYGAEVVLTDAALGMAGAIAEAERLAESIPNSFIPAQFDNPENPAAHYATTGPEIWRDTDGHVDALVCGVGTGGTITGTARYLKEKKADLFVCAVEPADSAVLSGGEAHPHALQGIGAGFVPKTLDVTVCDEVIAVTKDEAYSAARAFAKTEGVLCGISGGAALSAALSLARRGEFEDKTVVVLLPDSGERYLSTDLFE